MTEDPLTLDALRSFAVFAEHLNFTRAAQELHLSQPALHVKVAKLATAVGHPLYRREGRRLVLTDTGQSVVEFARRMQAETAAFLTSVSEAADRQPITIAAGTGAHLYLLSGAIRRMLERGDHLRLITADRDAAVVAVRTGEAHLGVTVLGSAPRGLTTVALATYPQIAVMVPSHPLARRRELTVADLDGIGLIVPPPDRPQRIGLVRAFRGSGVRFEPSVEVEGWSAMLQFAGLGIGVAVVNGCVLPEPNLVWRPIRDLPPVTYSAVWHPTTSGSALVEGVLGMIRASLP